MPSSGEAGHQASGLAGEEFPMSAAQGRLLVLDRMYPGSTQYHVPAAFAVHGPLDVPALAGAVQELAARHEALRTVFEVREGRQVQVVSPQGQADVRIHPGESAATVLAAMTAQASRPFDLGQGPLLRCDIYPVAADRHYIALVAHHLVCDGWSLDIMLSELTGLYRAATAGGAAPPEPAGIQYPDYAAWQQERLAAGNYAPAVAYWAELLAGAPPMLALPTSRPRPAVQSPAGGTEWIAFPEGTRRRVAALAAERRTTPFAVLFAACNAFLARLSGQQDLVVGVPVSGRDHPDVQGVVGMLADTLALRTDLSGDPAFRELLRRVTDLLDASRPYQDAPFSEVVDAVAPDRELYRDPVVQVAFGYYYDDDDELALQLAPARVERVDLALGSAKFDLLIYVERRGQELAASFTYRSDLFSRATIAHWADSFAVLLGGLLDQPGRPIAEAGALTSGQRQQILADWNWHPGPAVAAGSLVPDLVARRAAERPAATALACGDAVLTYGDLLASADKLARQLRAAGIGPGVPVGVCLPRSAGMAIAALAVLRAGGAYIPLDAEQPPARLASMVRGAGARLVIAAGPTAARAAGTGVPVAVLTRDGTAFAEPPCRVGQPAPASARPAPGDAAYILFTSGSTGEPKGVVVEHRALANLATAVRQRLFVTAADRLLQYVSFGFDVAVSDLFFAWTAGAELHIAADDERLGEALFARLRDSRITYVFLPPSAAMTLPCPPGGLPELRTLVLGGEAVPPELVQRWSAPGRRVVNGYGPSEAAVYATTTELAAGEPVVIGRPVPGARCYVLDGRLRPVPVGVTGEIYLAGAGLARGYAGRPDLTAERFAADPAGLPGTRMYRTGDLGRYGPDGVLSYHGRTDTQVKLRGFRVELAEIETVLAQHPAVTLAVATVRGAAGQQRLTGYVTGRDGAPPSPAELRAWAASRLPSYMVPETIVCAAELPLNRSGKVDRARLPEPPATRPDLALSYRAPATPTERALAGIWAGVLELDRPGIEDNFFDLGGNSIRLVSVLAELQRRFGDGLRVSMTDLFRYPSIAALAAHIDGADGADGTGGADSGRSAARQRGRDRRQRTASLAAARRRTTGEGAGDD
ncbi:MAG TPA: amino acid adenylation domain-containing protein [Streptosporangiaceae bacterium]